jgi:hypothetical protein
MDATVLVGGAGPVGLMAAGLETTGMKLPADGRPPTRVALDTVDNPYPFSFVVAQIPDGDVGAVMSLDDDKPGHGSARAVRAG